MSNTVPAPQAVPSVQKKSSPSAEAAATTHAPSRGVVQLKQSLTGLDFERQEAALAPPPDGSVQMRANVQAAGADAVHDHAAAGTRGGGGSLPHGAQIQQAFGSHDVSGVKAYTGADASAACEGMGASAYASGDKVAFAGGADLHTAAHEAAHVVQQRAGVSLAAGVGASGDRYEQHADQVADAVVAGKSAEPILDTMAGGGGGASAVQKEDADPGAGADGGGGGDGKLAEPKLGSYQTVAPYKEKQFVPVTKDAKYKEGAERAKVLQQLRNETALKIGQDTYGGIVWRQDKWPLQGVVNLVYQSLQVTDVDGKNAAAVLVTPAGEKVSLGSFAMDFAVGEARNTAIEWVAANVLKLSGALVKAGMTVLGVLELVLSPLEAGRGSTTRLTPDEVLADVMRVLTGQQKKAALDEELAKGIKPETMTMQSDAYSQYGKKPRP